MLGVSRASLHAVRLVLLPLSLALGVAAVAGTAPAHAAKPEVTFGGRILISDKSFPTSSKSVGAYIGALRKQSKDKLWEDKEKTHWKVHYVAFFRKPLNDLEVTVKLYDVSQPSAQRMIESYELYLDGRGQRSFSGNLKLRKADDAYHPNSRILMVLENRGAILAKANFTVHGEGKKFTGKVEFSEEDTKGNAP